MTLRGHRRRPPARAARGFTFLELLVVMAVLAVLLGLGIGFIASVGRATLAQQASAILAESGQRCLNLSAGGQHSTLEIVSAGATEGQERVEIRTAVQRQVLTANFEAVAPGRSDTDWYVWANEPAHASVSGSVQLDLNGHSGACAAFKQGGVLEYGNRSAFAMTDGLLVEAWVRPDASGRRMTLVRGDADGTTLWEVALVQAVGRIAAFDVELKIKSVPADVEGAQPGGDDVSAPTVGAPVAAGVWSKIAVSWDGRDAKIEVNGTPRKKDDRGRGDAAAKKARRLYSPPSGAVRITTGPTFVGGLDTLTIAGVFRTDEDVRRLPYGVGILRPALPIRIVFANGRLDPTVHRQDVDVRLTGPGDAENGGFTVVRFGLYGSLPPPYRVEATPSDAGKKTP